MRRTFIALITLAVVAGTSLILKFTWYDNLKRLEHINEYSRQPAAAKEPVPAVK